MSALTVGVNSSETLWEVDAVPDPEFGYYTVGSEIVRVIAGFPASTGYAHGEVFPAKIRVSRGTNGTTAASHLSGAALTAANAFSGGGGGSSPDFTDGTTTVSGVTTVQSGIVVDQGGGSVSTGTAVISDTDPGAIGAGNLWLDSSADTFGVYPLFVRDPTDAFWIQASIGDRVLSDGTPVMAYALVDADQNEIAIIRTTSNVGGTTAAHLIRVSSPGGDKPESAVSVSAGVITLTSTSVGNVVTSITIDSSGVVNILAANGVNLNGHNFDQAAFVDPATATAEDIANVLIAAGLMAAS